MFSPREKYWRYQFIGNPTGDINNELVPLWQYFPKTYEQLALSGWRKELPFMTYLARIECIQWLVNYGCSDKQIARLVKQGAIAEAAPRYAYHLENIEFSISVRNLIPMWKNEGE